MKYYGRSTIHRFLEDNVVYRNLVPMDNGLPSLEQLRDEMGVGGEGVPRKTTPSYAQVIVQILKAAQAKSSPGTAIETVVFVGDTYLNDITAFTNICNAGKWVGIAFIGDETTDELKITVDESSTAAVMKANRWSALDKFQELCKTKIPVVDDRTVLLLDLDKTTMGGRGRNDEVINQARLEAATETVASTLEDRFDAEDFKKTYDYFNQSMFHPFTTDNQDYLVYICLVVGYGLFTRYGIKCALENEVVTDFSSFLAMVDRRAVELPRRLKAVHKDVLQRFRDGDPTPFKAFRQAEYLATVNRMGRLNAETPVAEHLSRDIVITQEVQALALGWREKGALTFGLSDKPDEASIPTDKLVTQGYLPIHRAEMAVVGSDNGES